MNENNEKDSSIKDIISQVEAMGEPKQSFLKKPAGIVVVVLVVVLFIALLLVFIPNDKDHKEKTGTAPIILNEQVALTEEESVRKKEILENSAKEKQVNLTEEEIQKKKVLLESINNR